jgi:hypothetical protein
MTAKYGSTLSRQERNRSLRTALGTRRSSFLAATRSAAGTFSLAGLAAFRIVSELLLLKEQLLPSRKNELISAIGALENLVYKLHLCVSRASFGRRQARCPQETIAAK